MSRSFLRTSEDVGAPVLTGEVDSLLILLKAVLVTGYGETPSLGWSLWAEDISKHIMVFRPGSSDGIIPFVKVDDNYSNKAYATVTMFESMSNIDDGISPCPQGNYSAYDKIMKSAAEDTVQRPWKIIGDERGFWLLVQAWSGDTDQYDCMWEPHYIGEWTANDANNKHNWMTILHGSNAYGYFTNASGAATWLLRDPVTYERGSVYFATNIRFHTSNVMGIYSAGKNPQSVNGRRFYEPLTIYYDENFLLGSIPGVYSMIYKPDSGTHTLSLEERQPFTEEVSANTKLLTLCCRFSSNAYNSYVQRLTYIIGEGFRDAR